MTITNTWRIRYRHLGATKAAPSNVITQDQRKALAACILARYL